MSHYFKHKKVIKIQQEITSHCRNISRGIFWQVHPLLLWHPRMLWLNIIHSLRNPLRIRSWKRPSLRRSLWSRHGCALNMLIRCRISASSLAARSPHRSASWASVSNRWDRSFCSSNTHCRFSTSPSTSSIRSSKGRSASTFICFSSSFADVLAEAISSQLPIESAKAVT